MEHQHPPTRPIPPRVYQTRQLRLGLSLSLSHFTLPLSINSDPSFSLPYSLLRTPKISATILRHLESKRCRSEERERMASSATRVDLDGSPIKPMTICMIGAGGFIGSHLCEKLMAETPHKVLALDVYNDKIKHLLEPSDGHPWSDRIQFHRLNIKHDSRLEGLIKTSDLVPHSSSFFLT